MYTGIILFASSFQSSHPARSTQPSLPVLYDAENPSPLAHRRRFRPRRHRQRLWRTRGRRVIFMDIKIKPLADCLYVKLKHSGYKT